MFQIVSKYTNLLTLLTQSVQSKEKFAKEKEALTRTKLCSSALDIKPHIFLYVRMNMYLNLISNATPVFYSLFNINHRNWLIRFHLTLL